MERHENIVRRTPAAPEPTPGRPRDEQAKILSAWLWPTRENAAQPFADQVPTAAVEASLLPESSRLLRDFPVPGLERPYLRYLEQRILRDPRDLLAHVQRLFLARALRDADATTGALADLFLVLGRHGRPLRARLLGLVAAQLPLEQLRFFAAHLEDGLDASDQMPELTQSRLSKRLAGTTKIVVRKTDDQQAPDEPVTLARESLANGRYDVALAVLEGALESDPGDKAVTEELLQLYERGNLRESFFKTYTALLGRHLAFPERWARLATAYRSGADDNE